MPWLDWTSPWHCAAMGAERGASGTTRALMASVPSAGLHIDGLAPLDTRRNYLRQRRRGDSAYRLLVLVALVLLAAWLLAAAASIFFT
jgi:hypothetical protein